MISKPATSYQTPKAGGFRQFVRWFTLIPPHHALAKRWLFGFEPLSAKKRMYK
jgi:hypothetical protein